MHADNKLIKTMLSLLLVLFSVSSTISMEPKKTFKIIALYNQTKDAVTEVKQLYFKINRKIATASIVGIGMASGIGSGAVTFFLLKSYGAALLYGALSGQIAVVYQFLAKKLDKNFKELKELIVDSNGQLRQELRDGLAQVYERFNEEKQIALTTQYQINQLNGQVSNMSTFALESQADIKEIKLTLMQQQDDNKKFQSAVTTKLSLLQDAKQKKEEQKKRNLLSKIVALSVEIQDITKEEVLSAYQNCNYEELMDIHEDLVSEKRKKFESTFNSVLDEVQVEQKNHREELKHLRLTVGTLIDENKEIKLLLQDTNQGVNVLVQRLQNELTREAQVVQNNALPTTRSIFNHQRATTFTSKQNKELQYSN